MSSLMSATSSTVVNKAQWKNILVVGGEYLAVPHPQIFKDSDVKEQARTNLARLVLASPPLSLSGSAMYD